MKDGGRRHCISKSYCVSLVSLKLFKRYKKRFNCAPQLIRGIRRCVLHEPGYDDGAILVQSWCGSARKRWREPTRLCDVARRSFRSSSGRRSSMPWMTSASHFGARFSMISVGRKLPLNRDDRKKRGAIRIRATVLQ